MGGLRKTLEDFEVEVKKDLINERRVSGDVQLREIG
jgi:hypothetical protein